MAASSAMPSRGANLLMQLGLLRIDSRRPCGAYLHALSMARAARDGDSNGRLPGLFWQWRCWLHPQDLFFDDDSEAEPRELHAPEPELAAWVAEVEAVAADAGDTWTAASYRSPALANEVLAANPALMTSQFQLLAAAAAGAAEPLASAMALSDAWRRLTRLVEATPVSELGAVLQQADHAATLTEMLAKRYAEVHGWLARLDKARRQKFEEEAEHAWAMQWRQLKWDLHAQQRDEAELRVTLARPKTLSLLRDARVSHFRDYTLWLDSLQPEARGLVESTSAATAAGLETGPAPRLRCTLKATDYCELRLLPLMRAWRAHATRLQLAYFGLALALVAAAVTMVLFAAMGAGRPELLASLPMLCAIAAGLAAVAGYAQLDGRWRHADAVATWLGRRYSRLCAQLNHDPLESYAVACCGCLCATGSASSTAPASSSAASAAPQFAAPPAPVSPSKKRKDGSDANKLKRLTGDYSGENTDAAEPGNVGSSGKADIYEPVMVSTTVN